MKKYWYRRILIMALVFFVSVGGSYLLIEQKKRCHEARGERSDL